ncbi:VOC family protein [Rufibacter ruber]|uniref:SMU1112c/YaeR family gloxylase I-like metalloprotein n=1 Tax=Rufibacter ruber TaxID=1783499 RepID=UPI000AD222C9|nr:VOC family protein [Rufibacter ruber]
MLNITRVHHIAVICSDYTVSKEFYTQTLGLKVIREVYRAERQSYKLDLALGGTYVLELFSFPNPPARASFPEAAGLRHLAFETDHVEAAKAALNQKNVATQEIRVDATTGKRFFFFSDPDGLPLEIYEQ